MFQPQRVVVWFSAGVASAIAAKLAIEKYRDIMPVLLVNTDTGSEHDDNFRFMRNCEYWLDHEIIILHNKKYVDTFDVYRKERYLVGIKGARCTVELKKKVRQQFENLETDIQIFGFDAGEEVRASEFVINNPEIHAEFPLIDAGYSKAYCHQVLRQAKIEPPFTYKWFKNANCLKRGCVKGQAGYWNTIRRVYPEVFLDMAKMERELDAAINKVFVNGERRRVFLDELPKNMGNYKTEDNFQCSLFCG